MTDEHRTDRQTDKGRQADRQTNKQLKHAETHIKDKVLFDTADGIVELAFQCCFVVHLMLLQHRLTDVREIEQRPVNNVANMNQSRTKHAPINNQS